MTSRFAHLLLKNDEKYLNKSSELCGDWWYEKTEMVIREWNTTWYLAYDHTFEGQNGKQYNVYRIIDTDDFGQEINTMLNGSYLVILPRNKKYPANTNIMVNGKVNTKTKQRYHNGAVLSTIGIKGVRL